MKCLRVILLVALIFTGKVFPAENLPWTPTDDEFKVLPNYCWVKMKTPENGPEYLTMRSQYGQDFVHVHHYCAGMNFANRSVRLLDPKDRIYYKNKAFTNYKYMFDHADQSFNLMPDIYVSRGRLYQSDGNARLALLDYAKAVELNPKHAGAHLAIVELHKKAKRNEEALEAAIEGLKRVPNSRALQKRYYELGGKDPLPGSDEVKEVSEAKAVDTVVEQGVISQQSESKSAEPKFDAKSIDGEKDNSVPYGTAGNPWCRFCPELNEK